MAITPLPKLLIVDDEAAQMKALCQTLESEGYQVAGFTSANEAVAALREQVFDLVLSDLMMPEMDGITLMRTAFQIDPTLVGIVMTGHGTIDTAVQAMQEGAHDYILKPFKLSAILPVLARALAVRRLRLENIQLHQAVGMYELSTAIALAPDPDTVLQKFADAAFRQIGARHVSVLLTAPDGQSLQVAVSRGDDAGHIQGTRIPFSESLSCWLDRCRELLSCHGALFDLESLSAAPLPGLPGGISVPMLAGGKLIGILHFGSAHARAPIAPGQVKALNILAGAAASAIEGALLIEELRVAEQRYRRLSENAPDIVSRYEIRPQRRFVYVSPVVEAISGYTPEEHYADPDLGLDILYPEDRHLLEAVLRGDQPTGSTITLRWLHKNGHVIWIEQKSVLVRDSEGQLIAIEGIARDITERRKLEEQLQQAQRLEGVGRLAAGVAHDFNNILTVINGYSEAALNDLPSDNPLREDLLEILSAGERAAALTQQLLAFSRKQIVNPDILNLNAAVGNIQKMLQRLIGEDITLSTNLAADLGNVLADSGQLDQVMMNLAVNSRDAMPDGGALLIETGNVYLDEGFTSDQVGVRAGPHVMLSISDTGSGMTAETRARLFEPFFTTKPLGVGTGLGLATVYGIVKQSGGWIWVYSELGHGTTFKIYLPRIDTAVVNKDAIANIDARGTETILVVEDQPDVRKLTVLALKRLGYQVHSAGSPHEALEFVRTCEEPIHLLVTDVIMPGMTGRVLADQLEKLIPGLHVLFMSGYTNDAIAHHGVLNPGVAYLAKPFSAEALGAKVRKTLGPPVVPGATVLIVDDDDSVRRLLKGLLTNAGYSVLEASNGRRASELTATAHVDLVITDIVMPEQEGLETILRMRRENPQIRIVAMSGAFGGDFLKIAAHLGAIATLPKPLNQSELLQTVHNVLQAELQCEASRAH